MSRAPTKVLRIDEDTYHYLAWRAELNGTTVPAELRGLMTVLARADTAYLGATGKWFAPAPLSVEGVVQTGMRAGQVGRPAGGALTPLPGWHGVFSYGKSFRAKIGSQNFGSFASPVEAARAIDQHLREQKDKMIDGYIKRNEPVPRGLAELLVEVNIPTYEFEVEHRARQGCVCTDFPVNAPHHGPRCPGAGRTGADLAAAKAK